MPDSVLNVGNKHTYLIGKLIFFFRMHYSIDTVFLKEVSFPDDTHKSTFIWYSSMELIVSTSQSYFASANSPLLTSTSPIRIKI